MEDTLRQLLFDKVAPNHLGEVRQLMAYIEARCPYGEPIFLSLGESFQQPPKALLDKLGQAPAFTHGYQLSMYGLPYLRNLASSYIRENVNLSAAVEQGREYEISISWSGTRDAMYDYGQLLIDRYFKHAKPKVLMVAPGYDYNDIFENLGFETTFVALDKKNGYSPDIKKFKAALDSNSKYLIIINAQHNPTSRNWSPKFVRQLLDLAFSEDFPVLIDDAFYGVVRPNVRPTSALAILLDLVVKEKNYQAPWFYVRTFGKQYGIQGWGLGILAANPEVLDLFVNSYRTQHLYNYNGMLQYALAQWLSTNEPEQFLRQRNKLIFDNKRLFEEALIDRFGYPRDKITSGESTPFLLFDAPKYYDQAGRGYREFLDACLELGIVLTDAWPRPFVSNKNEHEYYGIRAYMGVCRDVVEALISRLESHGFAYDMRQFNR